MKIRMVNHLIYRQIMIITGTIQILSMMKMIVQEREASYLVHLLEELSEQLRHYSCTKNG